MQSAHSQNVESNERTKLRVGKAAAAAAPVKLGNGCGCLQSGRRWQRWQRPARPHRMALTAESQCGGSRVAGGPYDLSPAQAASLLTVNLAGKSQHF